MKNSTQGTHVSLKYVAPRKRNPKPWGISDDHLDVALERARQWVKENGGKFVSGMSMPCSFYDVESDGEKIRMQSVAWLAPAQVLTDEQLKQLNS